MPDATKILCLVLELHHRGDQGLFGQALDERIGHRLTDTTGEIKLLLWRELLIRKENHQMFEPDPANPSRLITVRGVGYRFEA